MNDLSEINVPKKCIAKMYLVGLPTNVAGVVKTRITRILQIKPNQATCIVAKLVPLTQFVVERVVHLTVERVVQVLIRELNKPFN